MNSKAIRKQLLAAVAMVLVAAVALGSSTYAWFASNSKVQATGMIVQAATEGGIEIAYTDSVATTGSYATSAATGATSATALAPISTANAKTWSHASAMRAGASAAKVDTYETLTLTEKTTDQAFSKTGSVTDQGVTTNYYLVSNFNIRSTSATALAKGLTVDNVSVAGNSTGKKMDEALRVAIVLGEKTLIYDPVANDVTGYKIYTGHTGSGDSATATGETNVTITEKDTATLLATTADTTIPAKGESANGGVDVKIYVYFEGEDAELYSDNFVTEALTVTVNFSATVA